MKKIIPNIAIKNCTEALEHYKGIFNAEIRNLQASDGNEVFKGYEGKIIHSELHFGGDCIIYLVDMFKEEEIGTNISLILDVDTEEEINKLYSALSKDGVVKFELQKTFWGAYHAIVTDRFGVTWGLNHMM